MACDTLQAVLLYVTLQYGTWCELGAGSSGTTTGSQLLLFCGQYQRRRMAQRMNCCSGWDLAPPSWPAAPYCAAMHAPKLRGAVPFSLSLKRRRVAIFPERIASSNAGDTAGRLLPTACRQCAGRSHHHASTRQDGLHVALEMGRHVAVSAVRLGFPHRSDMLGCG